jgi:F-type H+-transporting ATPase subunit b
MVELFNEGFFVACSFAAFVGLVYKPAKKGIISVLDNRTERAISALREAESLKAEASDILHALKRERIKARKEAAEIIEAAKNDAELLIKEALEKAEELAERKFALSTERIAQAEKQILSDIKAQTIELAVSRVEEILINELDKNAHLDLISSSLADTKKLVN